MKIAYIIPRLVKKGPIIVVKDLIKNIKNNGDVIHVYHFGNENDILFDCPTYRINLFTKIDFNYYDLVHSHMLKPDLFIYLHRDRLSIKPKYITTLHQNIFDNLSSDYNPIFAFFIEKIWIKILSKQDVIVTLTDVMKKYYTNKNRNLDFFTIYNGRDIDINSIDTSSNEFDLLLTLKLKYKLIGVHCLLTKRKGINQIIQALVNLKEYVLIIIGNGKELENLKSLATDLNVIDRCYFLGFKTNAISYLSQVDIYIMSSYSEGFPLALLEAGNLGKPIVCSDIEIFRELFSDNEVCFFELDNINSLVCAILEIENNSKKYSFNIKEKITNNYTNTQMAKNYRNLYENLLNN